MAGAVVLEVISAEEFKPGKMADAMRKHLKRFGRKLVKQHEKTTKSWKSDKPTFDFRHIVAPSRQQEVEIEVILLGSSRGINKWVWLNEGTEVRYAKLSEDWESKTVPGILTSLPGAGRVTKIDPSNPSPGIEAREWTEEIEFLYQKEFARIMQAAIDGVLT